MFAAYSGAAYTVSSEWNCSYACEYPGTEGTVVEYFWNVGTPESAGYIARNPKQKLIVVSFRGTENLPQWIENLDFSLVQWPEGVNSSHVHNGFVRSYLKVQDIVLTKVEELAFKYPDYWISLVGHSLGGAKAALCLLDLSIKLPELLPRLLLCTQGQPRVGNRGFASAIDALDIPKYREVYEFDIVPRIPLVVMGYHHYNHEVWDHVNTASICLEPTVLDGCAALGNFAYPLNIGDHTKYRGLSDNLYKYCEYAGAAYKVAGTAWDCPVNCNSTNTAGTVVDYHWSLKSIPSYGYVAHKDDTKEIIVSWRGSTVFMDWVADFTFMSTSWPAQIDGAKVHLGFLSAYNAAAGKVKDVVAGLVQTYPDYRIVLTGHSLGGAQAVLAAVDIATTRPEWISRIELYTFGQPRVGNSAFSNWLSKLPIPIFRTVYRSDIVPQVPLQAMGFQHQAQEVWYDLNMQTKFCGSNAENLSCQNSLSMAKWSALNHLQYPGLSFDPRYIITGKLEVIT
ncbi:hypothetical protein EV174_000156 [Coemansia sp. RSA 2320]|nr:hypothetical protein EV174_000156 [Coemansia sp. RSA 2320]